MCHCQSQQSREDFTRANTEGAQQGPNKARLDFAKKLSQTTSEKAFFGRLKLKSVCTRMIGRKVWRRLGTAHDPKHTTSSVKHGAVSMHERAWLPVALGYCCSVMRQKTAAR